MMREISQDEYQWIERYRPGRFTLNERTYLVVKRILDLLIVFISSPFWLVLMGLVALAIKIDSSDGPVFFIQPRTGKDGKRFQLLKFRTMVTNAEQLLENYKHLSTVQWPAIKIPNDPRVTKIGRFLRRTSLDELPQLINVIKGEMSLVGPRPTSFSSDTYSLWETGRLEVTPGLTGLWQIYGRGSTGFDVWSRMDILYINHRCLTLDFEILVRTVVSVLKQKGAI